MDRDTVTYFPAKEKSLSQFPDGSLEQRAGTQTAPGFLSGGSEKNTNSQPFRADSPLQQELSTHPQSQVQHLKEREKKKGPRGHRSLLAGTTRTPVSLGPDHEDIRLVCR
ncbi:uncharacterized protein M8220_012048 [Acridotheres tristis]